MKKAFRSYDSRLKGVAIIMLCLVFLYPDVVVAAIHNSKLVSDSIAQEQPPREMINEPTTESANDRVQFQPEDDSVIVNEQDSVLTVVTADELPAEFSGKRVFNPNSTRAVWMSALCPGLGQIYNDI